MENKDFKWFLENYNDLFLKYGRKFLAIKDQKVIGVYDEAGEAVRQTMKSEELGSFIVQKCTGDETGYTNYISSWQLVQV